MNLKKFHFAYIILLICFNATGCDTQIFEEEIIPTLVRYDKTSLEDGNYYIKDGTGFYKPYIATTTFNSSFTTATNSRVIWAAPSEEELIPTLYKNESFVYVSSSDIPNKIEIERFKDCGFSVGIMGFEKSENSQLVQYSTSLQNLKAGSDAYDKLCDVNSTKITIADVDGMEVDETFFAYGGILNNMEYGKEYSLGLYVGSYYKAHKIKADTRVLVSDSAEYLDTISLTKNGYFLINIPEDMPSGYYYIHGYGLFRYINVEKKIALNSENIDFNEDLKTTSGDSGLTRYSTITKKIVLKEESEYLLLNILFETEEINVNKIIITMPDGEQFQIKEYKGKYTHTIDSPAVGTYLIEINAIASEKDISLEFTAPEKKEINTEVKTEEEFFGLKDLSYLNEESKFLANENASQDEIETLEEEKNDNETQNDEEYEWVQVLPEPLEDTEVTDTKPAD